MSLTDRIKAGTASPSSFEAEAGAYIDLTPTPEGYAAIAATFCDSIIGDVKVSRRTDSATMLVEAMGIAFYLGQRSTTDGIAARELRDRMTVRIR